MSMTKEWAEPCASTSTARSQSWSTVSASIPPASIVAGASCSFWRSLETLDTLSGKCAYPWRQQARPSLGISWRFRFCLRQIGKQHTLRIFDMKSARTEGRWEEVIEDFKGFDLPLSKLKRAIVEAMFGTKIRITGKR